MSSEPPLPPANCPGRIYAMHPGDTLYSLSRRYGVSVPSIIYANPQITDVNRIAVNQSICIPILKPPSVSPRTCTLRFGRLTEKIPKNAGGILWMQVRDNQMQFLAVGINLPEPSRFGADRYTALFSWERNTFDLPLAQVAGISGLWIGYSSMSVFPDEFFRTGDVTVFPGPVLGGLIENCG